MGDFLPTADSIPLRQTPLTIVILLIAYLTILMVGLVGNFLVIVVVLKVPKMKTGTKYFILNLAVADLLVLTFCVLPSLISSIYVPWVMGPLLCKVVPYIQGTSVCASVYSLAAISLDRFLAVRSPLRRQVTRSMAQRIIIPIWIWAAGLAFPWLLYFDLSNADRSNPSLVFCIEIWPSQMHGNIYFGLVNLGLFYLFPLVFISFCHLRIWLRVRRPHAPTTASMSKRQLALKGAQASVQKLVIVVVVGFAVCWLPVYVIFARIKLIPTALGAMEEEVLDYALPIAQWLGPANSCINPILCVFSNHNFRLTLQRLLRGCFAYTAPENFPHPHHRPNQGSGVRPSLVHVSIEQHHRSDLNIKNSYQYAVNSRRDCHVVIFHPKKPKSVAIARSQSYVAAMKNPWWRAPINSAASVELKDLV